MGQPRQAVEKAFGIRGPPDPCKRMHRPFYDSGGGIVKHLSKGGCLLGAAEKPKPLDGSRPNQ